MLNTLGFHACINANTAEEMSGTRLDIDAATDKYVAITWTDFMGNFPGGELPATLASLSFASSEAGVDSLTGEIKNPKLFLQVLLLLRTMIS